MQLINDNSQALRYLSYLHPPILYKLTQKKSHLTINLKSIKPHHLGMYSTEQGNLSTEGVSYFVKIAILVHQ